MKSLYKIFKAAAVNMDATKLVLDPSAYEGSNTNSSRDDIVERLSKEEDIEQRAQNIVQKAKFEANGLIESAKREAADIIAKAQEEAREEAGRIAEEAKANGYNEGFQKGESESDKLIKKAKEMLSEAEQERKKTLQSLEPDMVNMVLQITEKLLGDTIALEPQLIAHLVKRGLEGATLTGAINIRVSPDDYDEVLRNKNTFLGLSEVSVAMEIIKDFTLQQFDCIIETQFGNIDCSLKQQFNTLRKNLFYIMENKQYDG